MPERQIGDPTYYLRRPPNLGEPTCQTTYSAASRSLIPLQQAPASDERKWVAIRHEGLPANGRGGKMGFSWN